jgi:type I restriction enzyme M protein
LKQERQQIQEQIREQRVIAREEQAAGDAIYWPIYNLDIKNPHAKQDFEHLPPEQLVEDILKKEQRIVELMVEIKQSLTEGHDF